jgi:hypothetical protein
MILKGDIETRHERLVEEALNLRPININDLPLTSADIAMIEYIIYQGCGLCQASVILGKSNSYLNQILTYEDEKYFCLQKWLMKLRDISNLCGLSTREKNDIFRANKSKWISWHRNLSFNNHKSIQYCGFNASLSPIEEIQQKDEEIKRLTLELREYKVEVQEYNEEASKISVLIDDHLEGLNDLKAENEQLKEILKLERGTTLALVESLRSQIKRLERINDILLNRFEVH